jgi:hypothetical protein
VISASQLDISAKVLYDFRNVILFDEELKDKAYILKPHISDILARFKECKFAPTRILIYSQPIK